MIDVRMFAGRDLATPVDWDPADPAPGYDAEHEVATSPSNARIRVRDVVSCTSELDACEELWSRAAYELINYRRARQFRELHDLAVGGMIERDPWLQRATRLEFLAIRETRRFYAQVWKPEAVRKGMGTDPAKGRTGLTFLSERLAGRSPSSSTKGSPAPGEGGRSLTEPSSATAQELSRRCSAGGSRRGGGPWR